MAGLSVQTTIFVIVPVVLAVLSYLHMLDVQDHSDTTHWKDLATNHTHHKRICNHGEFCLEGMRKCQKWLDCESSLEIVKLSKLGQGAVKKVTQGRWNGHYITINTLLDSQYKDDFDHGKSMLKTFSSSHHYTTQFIGECGDTFYTEYYPLGSLHSLMSETTHRYHGLLTARNRMILCVNYVNVISFLHSSPLGTRVMCDSNDLDKTLGQYLVRQDLTVVANDLDALPLVNSSAIKCGTRQLFGNFVAPEQLWTYHEAFDNARMPGYDEKTDIWKVPDVFNYIMGDSKDSIAIRNMLFKIHVQCKLESPQERTTAKQIVEAYLKVFNEYFGQIDKSKLWVPD